MRRRLQGDRRPFLALVGLVVLGGGVVAAVALESSWPVERQAARADAAPATPQQGQVRATPQTEAAERALEARARATGAYSVHGTDHGLEMDFTSDQKPAYIPGVTTVVLHATAARFDAADAYARRAVGAGHTFMDLLMNGEWQLSTNAAASVKADITARYGDIVNVLPGDGPHTASLR